MTPGLVAVQAWYAGVFAVAGAEAILAVSRRLRAPRAVSAVLCACWAVSAWLIVGWLTAAAVTR